MRIVQLATDGREHYREYFKTAPHFGTAPEALLQGFAALPEAEIHVVSCTKEPMQSPEKLAPNIWFHSLEVPTLGWLKTGYQGCIRAVRAKLKQINPDIVHGQGTERDCAISAVLSGFPNVVTIHGNMAELARLFAARFPSYHWLTARLENFTLPRTGGVFCNSAYTEALVKPRARQTWRVPNAIRQEFFSDSNAAEPRNLKRVLNVGVISPRKRQVEILDWAEKLHQAGADFEIHFVGKVNAQEPYGREFLSRMEGAGAYAKYLGTKSTGELIACFDQCGAMLHFPTEESFGLVVAEALSRNMKVFGSRLGGIEEIAAGIDGVELFPANDWDGLGNALKNWIQSPVANATASMQIQARYHPAVVAQQHLDIYKELLAAER